jgi:hypothetical protein
VRLGAVDHSSVNDAEGDDGVIPYLRRSCRRQRRAGRGDLVTRRRQRAQKPRQRRRGRPRHAHVAATVLLGALDRSCVNDAESAAVLAGVFLYGLLALAKGIYSVLIYGLIKSYKPVEIATRPDARGRSHSERFWDGTEAHRGPQVDVTQPSGTSAQRATAEGSSPSPNGLGDGSESDPSVRCHRLVLEQPEQLGLPPSAA